MLALAKGGIDENYDLAETFFFNVASLYSSSEVQIINYFSIECVVCHVLLEELSSLIGSMLFVTLSLSESLVFVTLSHNESVMFVT